MSEGVVFLRVVRKKIFKISKTKIFKNKNRAPQARDFCLVIAENAKNEVFSAAGAKHPAEGWSPASHRPAGWPAGGGAGRWASERRKRGWGTGWGVNDGAVDL